MSHDDFRRLLPPPRHRPNPLEIGVRWRFEMVALVQAGVADRTGRPPWLVAARPHGDAVRVTVWLRSGTSMHDLVVAAPLIAAACGAQEVTVDCHSKRQDRAMLIVTRPRWGWWSR